MVVHINSRSSAERPAFRLGMQTWDFPLLSCHLLHSLRAPRYPCLVLQSLIRFVHAVIHF
jgi:hypothetical protein